MLCREEYMDWSPGAHASTFGGNLVSCAAGVAALEVMKEEKVGPKALRSGHRVMRYLRELQGEIDQIGDVRGLGLMIGLELVKDRKSKKFNPKMRDDVIKDAFERGLSLLPAADSVIRIAPPLIMERDDVDVGLEILGEVLRRQARN